MVNRILRAVLALSVAVGLTAPAQAETWHRADTHHFTIYSTDKPKDVEEFAHELEKFDSLLRLAFSVRPEERPTKLDIYMVPTMGEVEDLIGRDNIAGFYRPMTEGSFAVSNSQKTRDRDRLSGKRTLFHEYAHHFMFNNVSLPAPAWFVEGFAEFVSTAEFKMNGDWYFGKPAFHRAAEIEYSARIPAKVLLTAHPSQISGDGADAYYGWAWALTHMLYMDSPDAGKQVTRYLRRMARGESSIDAATAEFGDIDALDSALRSYADGRMTFKKSTTPLPYRDEVRVSTLDRAQSAIVRLRMQRLGGQELAATRDALIAAAPAAGAAGFYELGRTEYELARNRAIETARPDATEDSEAVDPIDIAELDIDYAASEAALDRALALDGDHPRANIYKARILFDRADDMDGDEAVSLRQNAMDHVERAYRQAPRDPLALYDFATRFGGDPARRGDVGQALADAFEYAPESREIRFAHAMHLAREGQLPMAMALVQIIANDPHKSSGGKDVLRILEAIRQGGPVVVDDSVVAVPIDVEEDEGHSPDEADTAS